MPGNWREQTSWSIAMLVESEAGEDSMPCMGFGLRLLFFKPKPLCTSAWIDPQGFGLIKYWDECIFGLTQITLCCTCMHMCPLGLHMISAARMLPTHFCIELRASTELARKYC